MSITIYPSQFNMREDGSYEQLPAIKGETGEQGVPGVGALPGGTAGQVPVKQSGTDYDVAWANPNAMVTLSPVLTKSSGNAELESVSAVKTGGFVQVTMGFHNGNTAVTPGNNAFVGVLSNIPLPAGNSIGPSYSGSTAFMCLIDPEGNVRLRVLAANFNASADIVVSVLYIA